MTDPFLPEPTGRAEDRTAPTDDEIDVERTAVAADESTGGQADGGAPSVESGGADPIRLAQSRITPEELTGDLHEGDADS